MNLCVVKKHERRKIRKFSRKLLAEISENIFLCPFADYDINNHYVKIIYIGVIPNGRVSRYNSTINNIIEFALGNPDKSKLNQNGNNDPYIYHLEVSVRDVSPIEIILVNCNNFEDYVKNSISPLR